VRSETLRPEQVLDFALLYKNSCSACHGDHGLNGAALPLDNPVYLAWAGHDRMVQIVAGGMSHTLMPAFAESRGGTLTDQQVESIVSGMIDHWGKPGILNGTNAPGYTHVAQGDGTQGKAAFQTFCARCHGTDGKGISGSDAETKSVLARSKTGPFVGSIVDPTYLSLVSNQELRDIVVSGLPGGGMPDWRGDGVVKPMTDKDVSDIVAWLVSQRVQFPGQPLSTSQQ
ncbi:MAG: c-type cytochrome, partial [Silvibacterium sp.]